MICHHCYTLRHIFSDFILPLNKKRCVVANYENFTPDEKAHVTGPNCKFEKQFVLGYTEHRLAQSVKNLRGEKNDLNHENRLLAIKDKSPVSSNSEFVGQLCRLRRRVKREFLNSETIFVLAMRIEKVYANIGVTHWATNRYRVIMDTRAVSSFIEKDVIPQRQWHRIKQPMSDFPIIEAGNHRVNVSGTIDLSVELGSQVAIINFIYWTTLGLCHSPMPFLRQARPSYPPKKDEP